MHRLDLEHEMPTATFPALPHGAGTGRKFLNFRQREITCRLATQLGFADVWGDHFVTPNGLSVIRSFFVERVLSQGFNSRTPSAPPERYWRI